MTGLDLTGQTILVVDDIQFSRNTLASFINRMGQPTVHLARNGAEAIAKLGELGNVAFIIADFNMPVMHGLQMLKEVRSGLVGVRRDLPVAMVTGFSEKHLVDSALALDVNAFLIKPVAKQGLETRLERMLKNVASEKWLKSADSYRSVDVDDILGIDGLDQGADSDQAPSLALSKDLYGKHAEDGPENRFDEDDILVTPRELTEAEKGPGPMGMKSYLVRDVPEGAVLARDVVTHDGRKLMASGERVTPGAAALLADLFGLGHVTDQIWVIE